MSPVAIPPWNVFGVLPPVNSAAPMSSDRSPYAVTLTDFIARFANSRERIAILQSFLDFRGSLHGIGITQGFQWINGSFAEFIEWTERRDPVDIDVATFYYLPGAFASQRELVDANPQLFDHHYVWTNYRTDAYFIELDSSSLENIIEDAAYWYGTWSHRRNHLWKGYLQLDISPDEDTTAQATLTRIINRGGRT
jgi:hypothetical protein